jgi:broad specificity phosphatase PhoE
MHVIALTHAEVDSRRNKAALSGISFAGSTSKAAGSAQVKHAADFLVKESDRIHLVLSSPAGKCVDTAMEFARHLETSKEKPRIIHDWLAVDPPLWHDEVRKTDGPEMTAWPGDSTIEAFRRVIQSDGVSRDEVLQEWQDKTVLIVTHNRLAHTLPKSQADRFKKGAIKLDKGERFFSAKPVMLKCQFINSWEHINVLWAYSFANPHSEPENLLLNA